MEVGGLIGQASSWIIDAYSKGQVSGQDDVGGLAGYVYEGNILRESSNADVHGDKRAGGLVGSYTDISTINQSFSLGSVEGTDKVGGLIGEIRQRRTIHDNYTIDVIDSYSMGQVTGTSNVGGLIGARVGGGWDTILRPIRVSFWNTDTSGQTMSAGGHGLKTIAMYNPTYYVDPYNFPGNFRGWNDIWSIDEDRDYPDLIDNPR